MGLVPETQRSWAYRRRAGFSLNLADKTGDALELQYRHTLENLAKKDGLVGTIFRKSQN